MAARLELWEPCLDCASRQIEEQHTIGYDMFDSPVSEWFDICTHAHVCKRIVGLEKLGGDA